VNDRSTTIDVIRLTGEIDISRKQELRDALVTTPSTRAVLVDMTEVPYTDSTALAELLRFAVQAERDGIPIALIIATPQIERIVTYAGLSEAFRLFRDRGDALRYLEGR
jgi:anti-sigma B factor antagonist